MTDRLSASPPPRVMHVCLSRSWGGLEMYPARVAPELWRQGWEAHAVALKGSRVAESFSAVGVEPIQFRSIAAALCHAVGISRYLRAHDIRTIHAHKSSDVHLCALLATLLPHLNVFFTDHMGVRKPKKDLFHRWSYSKVTRLFSISQATYARNLSAFPMPANRITQLHYGIDLEPYTPMLSESQRGDIRSELGIPPDHFAIALPGRISEPKGHSTWVQALAMLRQKRRDLRFTGVIIGEAGAADRRQGGYLDKLTAMISNLGISDIVKFSGFRTDIARCVRACDIACIPSYDEAFGLSALEAMAAGTPVIGSNSGAIPELLADNRGVAVDPHAPNEWASALENLLSDHARAELGVAARSWAFRHFSQTQHVSQLISYYRYMAP